MKNIRIHIPPKYRSAEYHEVMPGIYQFDKNFVTSIAFEQEPDLGEGRFAAEISQYPLADILDHFGVFVSDWYSSSNTDQSTTCYIELSARRVDAIKNLHSIIGKHVYNKTVVKDGEEYIDLIIE